jgi:hypothetical protein
MTTEFILFSEYFSADNFTTNSTFNRTCLKNKLLSKIPELKPFHKGREVLLVFEKDVGPALVSACENCTGQLV